MSLHLYVEFIADRANRAPSHSLDVFLHSFNRRFINTNGGVTHLPIYPPAHHHNVNMLIAHELKGTKGSSSATPSTIMRGRAKASLKLPNKVMSTYLNQCPAIHQDRLPRANAPAAAPT